MEGPRNSGVVRATNNNNNITANTNTISNSNSNTGNGIVINIAAGGQHQVSSAPSAQTAPKSTRKVRRDASFRLPAFFGGSKCSVNGSTSPASSRRAPSPSSLSSVSTSSSPAFIQNNNNVTHGLVKGLDVHSHPESTRVLQGSEYLSSSSGSSSGDLISNVKIPASQMNETYKSLGDVFGINAAVASISGPGTSGSRKSPKHTHLKTARSVSNVLGHHDQAHRLSAYSATPQSAARFGSSDMRASYSERLCVNRMPTQHQTGVIRYQNSTAGGPYPELGVPRKFAGSSGGTPTHSGTSRSIIYKSNTSLDLDHEVCQATDSVSPGPQNHPEYQQLRREYGSQGSINLVMGNRYVTPTTSGPAQSYRERIYANPVTELGHPSPGPAAVSTLQRKPLVQSNCSQFTNNRDINKSEETLANGSGNTYGDSTSENSPKFSKKKVSSGAVGFFAKEKEHLKSQKSLFKKLRGSKESNPDPSSFNKEGGGDSSLDRQAMLDDSHRRRFFLHHDVGSICAKLSGATQQIKLLERKNTTTGASAASAALRNGLSSESQDNKEDGDHGDGISNELVLSCPYFRNEIGGEEDRTVALTKDTAAKRFQPGHHVFGKASSNDHNSHTPANARDFSLIDCNESYWKNGFCPYKFRRSGLSQTFNVIERVDRGATFYKNFFYGQDHQNWFGNDDSLGPLAISIRREKVPIHPNGSEVFITPRSIDPEKDFRDQFMYRLMVRTSDLVPFRGCVLEESIPSLRSEKIKGIPTKEVLEFVCPEIQLSSLHLGIQSGPCEEQLIRLDEAYVQNKYKVGLMYCREGQQSEEEMYNNGDGGPAFNEFLELIGQKVRLKGFNKYKAGLCSKNDSTGLYSVYAEHEGNEIMFHVSTLLPYTPNNRQQLPRKRYIGNDIVTVVFQEPGARPFIPNIKSQFQHVFIVVKVHNPCSENTMYSVAVSRSKSVPMFGPNIPTDAKFPKGEVFAKFLLTKIINAENAAHRSDKFVSMALRTRQELLKDLASNYVTQTILDSGSKFNLFTTKKKDKGRPRFSPDTSGLRGALSWRVVAEDCSTRHEVDAFLGVSPESIVLIQDNLHRDILFLIATKSVIGWTALQNSIRIFFHQGEALILHSKDWDTDDMSEIAQRLKSVTNGAPTQEFTLRRNQLGQLGFHVQHDGLITEVENFGYAWQTGLRQGSRLVEIVKTPVNALSHEQMVELLKASMSVTVTVIPPHPDGSPRQGCHIPNCNFISETSGDYENIHTTTDPPKHQQVKPLEQVHNPRSFSPPRSSNSSGYGTGSSRKSNGDLLSAKLKPVFTGQGNSYDGGLASLSSGQSSDEQRWYDEQPISSSETSSPPPLPNRIGSGNSSAFQRVSGSQTTLSNPESPNFPTHSSSSTNSSPSVYQHPPPPRAKVTETPSSRYNGYESPASNSSQTVPHSKTSRSYTNSPASATELHEEKRSIDARVTYLTEYELVHGKAEGDSGVSRQGTAEYLQHERLTALKASNIPATKNTVYEMTIVNQLPVCNDGNLHSRAQVVSEDEMSAVSAGSDSTSSLSRQGQHIQPKDGTYMTSGSASASRDHSPRLFVEPTSKVKRVVGRNSTNRNSVNFANSTLQEDLLKLIGPDFDSAPKSLGKQSSKSPSSDYTTINVMSTGNRSNATPGQRKVSMTNDLHLMRSRSRENIAGGGQNGGRLSTTLILPVEEPNREFHMARPATVISNHSSTSSPPDSKNISNSSTTIRKDFSTISSSSNPSKKSLGPLSQTIIVNASSGRPLTIQQQQQQSQQQLPLPDARQMDWTSLVDTATKAICVGRAEGEDEDPRRERMRSVESNVSSRSTGVKQLVSHHDDPVPVKETHVSELLEKVNLLETRLTSEAREKSHLAEEVAALREENQRLQVESQTAAEQLKKFTDWFFQAIDGSTDQQPK